MARTQFEQDLLNIQNRIEGQAKQANRFLDIIANELDSINKRVTKYLDRVENAMTDSIKVDMPPIMTCTSCLAEINYRGNALYYTCDHGTFCAFCGSCDECRENSTNEELRT